MDLSVILPTRDRAPKLETCLRRLAAQTLPLGRFEVLVGLDGPDEASARIVDRVARETGLRALAVPGAQEGIGAVKNRVIALVRAPVIVSINDDIRPEPGFLDAHLRAQRACEARNTEAMVLGDSPWVVHQPDRLFDRLIRESSMVFFYDQMTGAHDPWKDWGFRHAWNLNLSMPTDAVRAVGGYAVMSGPWFEDLELAWRLATRRSMPVLFRPDARAPHDHRYEPDDYLERELRHGFVAHRFAQGGAAACARALFGRDVCAQDELAYSREFLRRERAHAARLAESFRALASMPSDAVAGPHADALIRALYEQHLPLKRWLWRRGLVAAAEGVAYGALALDALGPWAPLESAPTHRPAAAAV